MMDVDSPEIDGNLLINTHHPSTSISLLVPSKAQAIRLQP
jgi:hypothetical protein